MPRSVFTASVWRVGRYLFWLTLGFVSHRQLGVSQDFAPSPYLLGLGIFLLFSPEVLASLPRLRQHLAEFIAASDTLVLLLLTYVQPVYLVLFAPLIVASVTLESKRYTLGLSLLAMVLSSVQGLFYQVSLTSVLLHTIVFLLSGTLSLWLKQQLTKTYQARALLEQKLEARSDYFLMRAHEIRTPLALIQASVELVLDGAPGPLTAQQREFIQNVDENCRNITLLAENMLTQSKLESGIFQPTFQEADVRTMLRAVTSELKTFTERRQQKIHTYYPQVLPLLPLDSSLLKQAVTNLVQNAIRHTLPGGNIDVSVTRNDSSILISVTDDGAGMTLEQRKKIFRRFEASSGGTGLGLLIVKQITELHGGRIYIDTSLGKGTTFMLSLPLPEHAIREQP
jgi:two-component system, OmpR family, sensor kinase